MRIAILDPFSGIAGDMTLGALLQVGLDPEWLRALPAALGLEGVSVEIRDVTRGEIVCQKVDTRNRRHRTTLPPAYIGVTSVTVVPLT